MIRKIYKFTILIDSGIKEFLVKIPRASKFLHAAEQHGMISLWYICDPESPLELNKFAAYKTGDEVPDEVWRSPYIGTFLFDHGYYVVHLFQIP